MSKNGYLLLNVDPKPNGLIPEPSQNILKEMGRWLGINGEAIYGTTPWMTNGEGPTKMETTGGFTEKEKLTYTPKDFRFTCKGDNLYAICLAWPGTEASIRTVWERLYPSEIVSIELLGVEKKLKWRMEDDAIHKEVPEKRPCEHAYVFKITRKPPFDGA